MNPELVGALNRAASNLAAEVVRGTSGVPLDLQAYVIAQTARQLRALAIVRGQTYDADSN